MKRASFGWGERSSSFNKMGIVASWTLEQKLELGDG